MIPTFNIDHRIQLPQHDSDPYALALPPGYAAKLFVPEAKPTYLRQSVKLADIIALETYLRCYVKDSGEQLGIYIDTQANTITAVLDHTAPSQEGMNTNSHVAKLELVYSDEFFPLSRVLGKPLSQVDFLDFIDQHSFLFLEAASLISVVETFQQIDVTRFKSCVNQANGTGSLSYETEAGEGSTAVPRSLSVICPIFQGQPDQKLEITLRTKASAGKVAFTLLCHALQKIVRDEVLAIETRLHEFLKAENFNGALIVRGIPTLFRPEPAKVIDIETKALPVGFGTGAPSTVSASAGGSR